MSITEGEVFRNTADGVDFIVKKIVNDMVVLQSQDGKRQILTGVRTLTLTLFSQKTGRHFDPDKYGLIYCPVCKESGKLFNEVEERVVCKICGGGSASLRKRKKVISMIMGFIQAGRNGAFDREESRKEIGYGNL